MTNYFSHPTLLSHRFVLFSQETVIIIIYYSHLIDPQLNEGIMARAIDIPWITQFFSGFENMHVCQPTIIDDNIINDI